MSKLVKLAEKINPKSSLKRALGVFHLTLAGVGMIVGAGIYVLIGEAAAHAGNMMWISFLIAAVVSILTALSYAELSSMFPRSSGEFLYIKNSFGISFAIIVTLFILFESIMTVATVSLGFSSYLSSYFPFKIPLFVFALVAVFFFSLIAIKGIKESSWFNVFLTFIEVGGLLFVIVIGLPTIFSGPDFTSLVPDFGFWGVFTGAGIIFFAFQGISGLVKFSDEAKNPRKQIPIAIILTVIISVALYLLVGISAIASVGWQTLSTSPAPLSEIAKAILGSKTFFIFSLIALVSTANTILLNMIAGSRLLYDISLDSKPLKFFSKVNPKSRTPIRAILFIAIIGLLFAFLGDIGFAAQLANFALFVVYFFVNCSLIYFRVKQKGDKPYFRAPFSIRRVPITPVLGCITSLTMFAFLDKIVIAIGIMVIGVIYGIYIGLYGHKEKPTLKKKFKRVLAAQPTIGPKIPLRKYKQIRKKKTK